MVEKKLIPTCKDCKHRRTEKVYGYGSETKTHWCNFQTYLSFLGSKDNHYCSLWEKKADE